MYWSADIIKAEQGETLVSALSGYNNQQPRTLVTCPYFFYQKSILLISNGKMGTFFYHFFSLTSSAWMQPALSDSSFFGRLEAWNRSITHLTWLSIRVIPWPHTNAGKYPEDGGRGHLMSAEEPTVDTISGTVSSPAHSSPLLLCPEPVASLSITIFCN